MQLEHLLVVDAALLFDGLPLQLDGFEFFLHVQAVVEQSRVFLEDEVGDINGLGEVAFNLFDLLVDLH